jgi:outer membrane biosynthesis protein TonB
MTFFQKLKPIDMKKKSIFLILICVFTFSIVTAFEPETTVRKVLTGMVTYPQKAKDQMIEGTVTVIVMIQDDGKVIVKKATSESDVLKDGVVEQLKTAVIEPNSAYKNNSYTIQFTFKLIK